MHYDVEESNVELKRFADSQVPSFYKKYKKCVTEHQILKAVKKGELFGMVECDISIGDQWP
ncbi:hypothetical protein KUTeg_022300 [Tegillarca granosa]|uniref:Uncharacterized protein n=1 Tax=Tegillarca granosa TaxID=220873 RepID=A0ABQ9E8N3_TEGGR|nr:hypothetical protein KUTeg_022300 [Tegillarca granosa]